MEPKPDPIKEILSELFGLLEASETQSMAILEFLKDQKIVTEEKLKPYLDRAGNASSVRWRAARARMEYLLTPQGKKGSDSDEGNTEAEKKGTDHKEADKHEQDDAAAKAEPKSGGSVQKSATSEKKANAETKETTEKKNAGPVEQSRGATGVSANTGDKPSQREESAKQTQARLDKPADASSPGKSGARNEGKS